MKERRTQNTLPLFTQKRRLFLWHLAMVGLPVAIFTMTAFPCFVTWGSAYLLLYVCFGFTPVLHCVIDYCFVAIFQRQTCALKMQIPRTLVLLGLRTSRLNVCENCFTSFSASQNLAQHKKRFGGSCAMPMTDAAFAFLSPTDSVWKVFAFRAEKTFRKGKLPNTSAAGMVMLPKNPRTGTS